MKAYLSLVSITAALLLAGCNASTTETTDAEPAQFGPVESGFASSSAQSSSAAAVSELTEAQKYTLAYMWNEEKLAKDLYLALNDVWPHNTLYTIATRAETEHQAAVEGLIETYDLNITNLVDYEEAYSEAELRAFGPGEFGLAEIQELYDVLYSIGIQSAQDALEAGCMVEVTDVNDLNEDLLVAEGADDLVAVFEHLRSGSYNHYWAFDTALKGIGVSEGCCILGDDYCKTEEEYPTSNGSEESGNSSSAGNGGGKNGTNGGNGPR